MEIVAFLFKLYLTYYFISNYGIIFGCVIFYLSMVLYRIAMKKIFNLEKVNNLDLYFIGGNNREKFNLIGVFFFDDLDIEKMKKIIIERSISKIKKFRMRLVRKFAGYYWKEVPLQDAIKTIKIIENHNFTSEGDIMNYLEGEVNNHVDILKDMPYECQLIKFNNDSGKGVMVLKLDHTLSDGLGIISATLLLADNYSEEIFPPIMRMGVSLPWYYLILNIITFPYYGLYVFYNTLFSHSDSTPLRKSKKACGKSNFILSTTFEINSLANVKKMWKVSFNDLMMCAISRATKRFVNQDEYGGLYKNLKNIKVAIPVGRKPVPKTPEMIKLNNEINMIYFKLPLIDHLECEHKVISRETKKHLMNPLLSNAAITMANIMGEYVPMRIIHSITDNFMDNVDLIISNVPGPMCPLYFAGSKLTKLIPITSNSRTRAFIPILSYDKKFNLLLTIDSESGIDKKEFMTLIEEEIAALSKI